MSSKVIPILFNNLPSADKFSSLGYVSIPKSVVAILKFITPPWFPIVSTSPFVFVTLSPTYSNPLFTI